MRTTPFTTSFIMPLVATAGLIGTAAPVLAEESEEPLFEVSAFIAGFTAEVFSGESEGGPGETLTYPHEGGGYFWLHDHEWTPWGCNIGVGGEDTQTPGSYVHTNLDTTVFPDSLVIDGQALVSIGSSQGFEGFAEGVGQVTGEFHLHVTQSLLMDYELCCTTLGTISNAALHLRKLVNGNFQPLVSNVQMADQGEACIEATMLLEPGYYQVHFGGYVINDTETVSWGNSSKFDAILDFTPYQPADLTGDGVVDGTDLTRLLGSWGTSASGADINGDGIVDAQDLAILLGAWS